MDTVQCVAVLRAELSLRCVGTMDGGARLPFKCLRALFASLVRSRCVTSMRESDLPVRCETLRASLAE